MQPPNNPLSRDDAGRANGSQTVLASAEVIPLPGSWRRQRQGAANPWIQPSRAIGPALLGFVALAMVIGGSSRYGLFMPLLELVALAVFGLVWMRRGRLAPMPHLAPSMLVLLVLATLSPLLWSIPVSAVWWQATPAGALMRESFNAAGMALPTRGLGVVGGQSTRAAAFLLIPLAALLLVSLSTVETRRKLVLVLLGLALANALLGFAQFVGERSDALRMYRFSSLDGATGFFANRNHLGTLFVAVLPLAMVTGLQAQAQEDRSERGRVWLVLAALLLLILGCAATMSRAAILLGAGMIIAAPALLLFAARGTFRNRTWTGLLVLCIGAAVAVGALVAGPNIGQRLERSMLEDKRAYIIANSATAAGDMWPFGAGAGSFVTIYQGLEPIEQLQPTFVNHAHNDFLEILVEFGFVGAMLVVAGLWFLIVAAMHAWRGPRDEQGMVARAASLGIAVILLHSLVDYPLRTPAIAVLMAILAGLMLRPLPLRLPTLPAGLR